MKTYKSRVDSWLAVMMCLPFVSSVVVLVVGLAKGPTSMAVIGGAVLVGVVLLYALLVLPVRYVIDTHGLEVRAGRIIRIVVPWDRLISAAPSRNPLSSPALSLQRIDIEFSRPNGKPTHVLISPVDREAFLRDLVGTSSRHRLDNGRVVAV